MKAIFFALIQITAFNLFAQKEDFQWPLGYDGSSTLPNTDNFIMDFSKNEMKFLYAELGMTLFWTNGYISKNDSLLLYSNGCQVNNKYHQLIENGDSIIVPAYKEFCVNQEAYKVFDGGTLLPYPEKLNRFYMIQTGLYYEFQPTYKRWTKQLSFTDIDLNLNNGNGKVLSKNHIVLEDSLGGGQLEAVRHANGRDWWLVQNRLRTNKYFIFIFDDKGLRLSHTQEIGPPCMVMQEYLQAAFSPDGAKFVKGATSKSVLLFDFDRCEGLLSNIKSIDVINSDTVFASASIGLCFSPNNRFLYVTNSRYLFQYDTWATDINDSMIEIEAYTTNPIFPDQFGRMELAPDGNIYMTVLAGSDVIHTIHNPNEQGLDCDFERSGIKLPFGFLYWGFPNQPNWRLGPIDGSSCDTLGINNIPWAHWRWRSDYFEPLKVHFRDLAGFEPTDWLWDFGDGQTSMEKSPIHDFASAGEYTVCCNVSNQFGQDSMCRLVKVTTVLTQEPFLEKDIKAAPNPTNGPFKLYFSEPLERESLFELFDISGKTVFSKMVSKNVIAADFDFSSLGAGLFVWRLSSGGVFLANGKVAIFD